MSQSGSLFLDVVRFGAALCVLAHHLCDSSFSVGWVHLGALGYNAVAVFFVLSGFIIRFITMGGDTSGTEYTADRLSRLYSVVLPALLCTVVCEGLCEWINPTFYSSIREHFLWSHVPIQLLLNAAFLSQCWGYGFGPLSNAPFWSLSYEAFYYAAYGILFFRPRFAALWLCLLLLIAGPNIAGLGITWTMGALAANAYVYLSGRNSGLALAWGAVIATCGGLVAFRSTLVRTFGQFNHQSRLDWMAHKVGSWQLVPGGLRTNRVPWIEMLSPTFIVIALLTSVAIVAVMLTLDVFHPDIPRRITRSVRWIANGTFALYLFHVPLMMLVVTLLGHPIRTVAGGVFIALGVTAFCIWLSVYLDRWKNVLRRTSRELLESISATFRRTRPKKMVGVGAS